MKFCIVSRIDEREPIEIAQSLGWQLLDQGHEVVYEESVAAELGYSGVSLSANNFSADLVVVLGGDGSVLRAVRLMGEQQIPIVGINQGRVGFLTDLEREHATEILTKLSSPIPIEQRMRVTFSSKGKQLGSALNEGVIVTARPAKMLQFSIFVDGKSIGGFRADGLIIGTPTGSTAYAMSAGGPIVDPSIEALLLVPLAPYMMSSRPYLISSKSEITVELISSKPAQLVIDGQEQFELGEETVITIQKAVKSAQFVNVGRSFYEKVEQKLRLL